MYGVLLLSTVDYIKEAYDKNCFTKISQVAEMNIAIDKIYPESLFHMMSKEINDPEFYEGVGHHLVKYLSNSPFEPVFFTLWTEFKDFLHGLEKFNDYFKIFFPTTETPILTIIEEKDNVIKYECRSNDERTIQFSVGLFLEVALLFYKKWMSHSGLCDGFVISQRCKTCVGIDRNVDCTQVVPDETSDVTLLCTLPDSNVATIDLSVLRTLHDRNNTKAILKVVDNSIVTGRNEFSLDKYVFPMDPKLLGHIFPYSIVISSKMTVISLGVSLLRTFPEAQGHLFSEVVILNRPNLPINRRSIMKHSGRVFDLLMKCVPTSTIHSEDSAVRKRTIHSWETIDGIHYLRLKGKIMFIKIWEKFIFFGTPVLMSLTSLHSAGINICHLSMHDFSRDLMLAEAQQTVELKMTFDQGQEKQRKLENFLHKLNEEMKRTNAILNEMVPENSVFGYQKDVSSGMKVIENVTVLISDIVQFTTVCSLMKPMEVVTTLNAMYSKFDSLTAKHGAYKVETIGDAYMIVSTISGKGSPQKVCDVALDMREAIKNIKDPKTGTHLQIRIGIHTGTVVAGIVGLKVPKFCLFGTTVKTAVLLEASSSPMKIKISQSTKDTLPGRYNVTESEVLLTSRNVMIATFWLNTVD